jgi:hypothetical protein
MPRIGKAALLLAGISVGCQPAVSRGPAPAPEAVTVRQVVTTQALVGATVMVTGRCLGQDSPVVALGGRPQSGQVWQIEENGVAAWVIGPRPKDCDDGTAAITARVAQDTLPRLSPSRWARQYLVVR